MSQCRNDSSCFVCPSGINSDQSRPSCRANLFEKFEKLSSKRIHVSSDSDTDESDEEIDSQTLESESENGSDDDHLDDLFNTTGRYLVL